MWRYPLVKKRPGPSIPLDQHVADRAEEFRRATFSAGERGAMRRYGFAMRSQRLALSFPEGARDRRGAAAAGR